MTITQTVASKLFVGFVAIAFALSLVAPASAQTEEELQAQIDSLMATINSLSAQLGQAPATSGGSSASVCPYAWTRSLNTGATGADVMALQKFLNANPATAVAATGVGSAGMETDYFGGLTAAAVSNFQVMYRDEILTPVGLVNPTGYFGPSTMAKANALCASAPVMDDSSDDDMMDDDDDASDDDDDFELSGEADLSSFTIDDAEDDEIEEGDEDAPIGELTVEFADGDAEISRLDLVLVADGANTELDPWDVFDSISLWVDGDKVAEENADDRDDYLDEDDGSLRFSGLDIIGEEDEEVEITIAASLQGNLDGMPETWYVGAAAMRFFDADGVATTDDTTGDLPGNTTATRASFTIDEAGSEDELIVKTSTNDPDGTTLQVEDNSDSDWYTVFIFDLDTDDSVNDIELNTIAVNLEVASGTAVATLVDDAELVIDGVTIDDFTASSTAGSGGATSTYTFDVDGDVVIDAGDRVEAELRLKFNALDAHEEGVTIQAEITAALADATIDAEGADDLDPTSPDQIRGAATGDVHTLRTSGADVEVGDTSASVTAPDSGTNDYGTYEIELEVTAFEQDVYISTNPATSISYTLEDGASSSTYTGTRSVTLTSTGEEVSNAFEITEGSTETITLTVTYTPGVANTAARLQLNSITFGETSGTPTGQTWTASPESTYRTSVITMVD